MQVPDLDVFHSKEGPMLALVLVLQLSLSEVLGLDVPHKTDKSFWRIKRVLQYRFNVTHNQFNVTVVFLLYLMRTNLPVIFNTVRLERI